MRAVFALLKRNLLKLRRDKMKLFMNLFMSGVFLFIFSFVVGSPESGVAKPLPYLITGITVMVIFQTAMNNSMNILDDISSGFMKEILVAPVSRKQIAAGHVFSAAAVSVVQGLVIYIIGLFMGLNFDIVSSVELLLLMIVVGLTFSSLGLLLATTAKNSSNFQLLIAVLVFPLTFLSGAYIPLMSLPGFLQPAVYLNPLSYAVASFRYIALEADKQSVSDLINSGIAFNIDGIVITPLIGEIVIGVMCIIFFFACVRKFSKSDFSSVKVFRHGHR